MIKQIGYDIDGCVLNSSPFFIKALMDKYDIHDIRHKDKNGHETFYFDLKVPSEEVSEIINYTIVKYHHIMKEVFGAKDSIRHIWSVIGDKPIFLTARKDYYGLMDNCFHNWMQHNEMLMPYIYKRVNRHRDKIEAVKELGLTHYVEDRYKNAHDLAPWLKKVYLLDTDYNDRPLMAYNIQRVYHWTEIVEDYVNDKF